MVLFLGHARPHSAPSLQVEWQERKIKGVRVGLWNARTRPTIQVRSKADGCSIPGAGRPQGNVFGSGPLVRVFGESPDHLEHHCDAATPNEIETSQDVMKV